MDVDSETDSNHDTALTLGCAGGHEDLVELLISRGADIGKEQNFTLLLCSEFAMQHIFEEQTKSLPCLSLPFYVGFKYTLQI
jgi:ankyrin repeat protein